MKSHQVKFWNQEVERQVVYTFSVFFLLAFTDEAAFALGFNPGRSESCLCA